MSSNTSTIGVTAATGTIGSIVVHLLQARGLDVRPLGRDAASGVGLDGVDALFLACGNVPEQVAFECAVIDAAQRSGVGRIVKLSARGAEIGSAIAYWHWHGLIEQHLQASGIPATVLQPGFAMTNLLGAAEHVRQQGMLFAPAGTAPIAMVDPRDVAAVAAVALTDGQHEGRTYVLTGPAAINYDQVAADLSTATGRRVGYVDIPPEAAVPALVESGLPPFAAEQIVTIFGALRGGAQSVTTDNVEVLTRSRPRSFATFAHDYAAAFASDAPARLTA